MPQHGDERGRHGVARQEFAVFETRAALRGGRQGRVTHRSLLRDGVRASPGLRVCRLMVAWSFSVFIRGRARDDLLVLL